MKNLKFSSIFPNRKFFLFFLALALTISLSMSLKTKPDSKPNAPCGWSLISELDCPISVRIKDCNGNFGAMVNLCQNTLDPTCGCIRQTKGPYLIANPDCSCGTIEVEINGVLHNGVGADYFCCGGGPYIKCSCGCARITINYITKTIQLTDIDGANSIPPCP